MSTRYPITLPLLPGLRWQGKLRVNGKTSEGYAVAFDAENPTAAHERYVFDCTVLTAKQLKDWTGWEE